MTRPAIEAEGLVGTFGEVRALDSIDMVAEESTVFGLLGPNGAGKTTAVRVLSALLRPDAGRAFRGRLRRGAPSERGAAPDRTHRRRKAGHRPQGGARQFRYSPTHRTLLDRRDVALAEETPIPCP